MFRQIFEVNEANPSLMSSSCIYSLVKAARMSNDATVILVTWTVTDQAVTTLSLEIQEGGEGQWEPVKDASNLRKSTTEFKVTDLNADKSYKFRMDMRRPGEQNPTFVYGNVGMIFINLSMSIYGNASQF